MEPANIDSVTAAANRARCSSTGSAPSSSEGMGSQPICSPGDLEREHQNLLHLLSDVTESGSEEGLESQAPFGQSIYDTDGGVEITRLSQHIDAARQFIGRGRHLGVLIDDPGERGECQRILNYWAIFIYRLCQETVEAHLLPFDATRAPELDSESFPYHFNTNITEHPAALPGWRRLLDECEQRLANGQRFLAIVGSSGSGRSVLANQVLVPLLKNDRGRLEEFSGSSRWRYFRVRSGEHWLKNLAESISPPERSDPDSVKEQEDSSRRNHNALKQSLARFGKTPIVFVVDSLDGIPSAPDHEREPFLQNLAALLKDSDQPVYFITALRRELAIQPKRFGPLEGMVREGQVLMAFTTAELRRFIEEPARTVGLVFDRGLIDQILIDIQGEPTALPLLQFTLERLWQYRLKNRITWQSYDAAGAGQKSLRIAAEQIYDSLDEHQQEIFQRIIEALVLPQPGGTFDTCELSMDDLYRKCGAKESVTAVVDRLMQAKLLQDCSHDENVRRIRIRYTALLSAWPRLADWLGDLQVKHRRRLELHQEAQSWQDNGRTDDLLLRGIPLAAVQAEFDKKSLTQLETDFIERSLRRERNRTWLRRGVITTIFVLFCGLLLVWSSLNAKRIADRMLRDSMDAMKAGDISGGLAWLDAKNQWLSTGHVDTWRKQIAARQLPHLRQMFFAKPMDTSDGQSKDSAEQHRYPDFAVSQNQQLMFALWKHREACSLRIFDLESGKQVTVLLAEILSQNSDKNASLLVTSDGRHLLVTAGHFHIWEVSELKKLVQASEPASSNPLTANAKNAAKRARFESLEHAMEPQERDLKLLDISKDSPKRLLTSERKNGVHGNLRIWTFHEGPAEIVLEEMTPPVSSLDRVHAAAINETGDRIAAARSIPDGTDMARLLQVWTRPSSGNTWESAKSPIWSRALSESRIRAMGWKANPNDEYRWEKQSDSYIRYVCFAPQFGTDDQDLLVTAADDGEVSFWGISQLAAPSPMSDGAARPEAVPQKPTASFEFFPQTERAVRVGAAVFHAAFVGPKTLVIASRDRTARFWDFETRSEIIAPFYHEAPVTKTLLVSGNSVSQQKPLFVTNTAYAIRLWELPQTPAHQVLHCPNPAIDLSNSPQSSPGAADELPGHLVFQWNNKDGRFQNPTGPLFKAGDLKHAVIGPGGDLLAFVEDASADGRKMSLIRDTKSGRNWTVQAFGEPVRLTQLFESPSKQDELIANNDINHIAFHYPTKLIAAVGGKPNTNTWLLALRKMDAPSGVTVVNPGGVAKDQALFAAFNKTGSLLVTTDVNDDALIWDLDQILNVSTEDVKPIVRLRHTSDVIAAGFDNQSGRRSRVVTVSSEGEASVWEIDSRSSKRAEENGVLLTKFAHDAKIRFAAFNATGDFLVTASQDKTARVWDIHSGYLVAVLRHPAQVLQAWFLSDKSIVTISGSTQVSDIQSRSKPANGVVATYWDLSPVTIPDSLSLQLLSSRQVSDDHNRLQTMRIHELAEAYQRASSK